MKKNKIKTILILIIIIVLCLSLGVYAGYTLSATEVSYTKSDGTTVNVKEALDELYTKKSLTYTAYSVGDEVSLKSDSNEKFYVLEATGKTEDEVTLLAKYNLNTSGTAQQNATYSTTACAFSNTNYWSSSFTSDPFNLNDITGYESTDAIGKAKSYGASIGAVFSRLLTYEEANDLRTVSNDNSKIALMLWGRATTTGYVRYWLGSSKSEELVWCVSGSSDTYNRKIDGLKYSTVNNPGVRPVVIISKSLIL